MQHSEESEGLIMKYLMFGEMMLRLKPTGFERLFQNCELQATFAGSEANVAVSLATFGEDAEFISVFPANNIVAKGALKELRGFGVKTDKIVTGEGRFGVYFIEQGSNLLPNKTYYDRQYSSMCLAGPGSIDWDEALEGVDWLHLSGITSAISESAAALNLEAAKAARAKAITVSCDLNYRGNLWKYGKEATDVIPELVRNIDITIATESEIKSCLGITAEWTGKSDGADEFPAEKYLYLSKKCMEAYPNLKYATLTLQKNYSADANMLCSTIYDGKIFVKSKELKSMNIIDRVGAGDAIAAGLIYGLNHYEDLQDAADFGVAAGTLKGSIIGDFNRVEVEDVEGLMKSGDSVEQKR